MEVLEVEHQAEHRKLRRIDAEPDPAEEVDGPLGVALVEADQDQVEHDVEGAAEAVLGPAGGPGPVVDHQLGDPGALPGGEDRDEPVHLAVEPDPLEHLAAVGLHRAAEVVERDAREPGDQAVGDPRGDLAASARCPCGRAASPRRRRSPRRARRAAGGCRPGRSGGRRPSGPGSSPAPGRAPPRARRSGRSCGAGRRRGRARGRASWICASSPPSRRSSRHRRRSARSASGERAEDRVELGVERDDVLDLVVDGDQDREVEDRGRVEHGRRVRHRDGSADRGIGAGNGGRATSESRLACERALEGAVLDLDGDVAVVAGVVEGARRRRPSGRRPGRGAWACARAWGRPGRRGRRAPRGRSGRPWRGRGTAGRGTRARGRGSPSAARPGATGRSSGRSSGWGCRRTSAARSPGWWPGSCRRATRRR